MRTFLHHDAHSVAQACRLLYAYGGRARLNAGGSDLLAVLKADVLPVYPEAVINVKTIPGLDYIREDGGYLRIGAMTRLAALARSPLLQVRYRLLAEAVRAVDSPQIRNVATLGGNLCQDTRCWYYRYPRRLGGPPSCRRKDGGTCPAVAGDNRYHAVMGGDKCFTVCPSDLAVALAALDGRMVVAGPAGERRVGAADFFHPLGNDLARDEMVRTVEVPVRPLPTRQTFSKFTLRKPIDFAVVSVAAVVAVEEGVCTFARIVLGAVAPFPVRARAAEELLAGRALDEEVCAAAGAAALHGAKPLAKNGYKVPIARTLVKRALLAR